MTGVGARARRLVGVVPSYLRIAWWGLAPGEREPLVVHQGVVLSEQGVLLTVRVDLRGWELPGGHAERGESHEETVCREILEETGLRVAVDSRVGDYVRTGFLPHTARVSRCRVVGGSLRSSAETPVVCWFPLSAVPRTLFPDMEMRFTSRPLPAALR